MSEKKRILLSAYQATIISLLDSSSTLSLGTVNNKQEPEVGLVPFLYHKERFWVFVSQLSPHTQHLLNSLSCSLLLYDNQSQPKNHFAVERLSVTCHAQIENDGKECILDLMTEKLGETISLLRQLGDFHLFSLAPIKGRFIAGFGQAFIVDFPDMTLKHIGPSTDERDL